nr:unnamed protein product [Callosobruchus chinensis]
MAYKNEETDDMHYVYDLSQGNGLDASRRYAEMYPQQQHPSHIDCGRHREVRRPQLAEAVLNLIEEQLTTGTRKIAFQLNVDHMTSFYLDEFNHTQVDIENFVEQLDLELDERQQFEDSFHNLIAQATMLSATQQSHKRFKELKGERHAQKFFYTQNKGCPICNANYKIYYCAKFLRLSISDRLDKVNSLKLCLNCLRSGHKADSGKYDHCAKCPNKHNSLLHADQPHSNSQSGDGSRQGTTGADQGAGGQTLTSYSVAYNQQVLLSTAVVLVTDDTGKAHECRALLDSGSQSNFVTERLADKLELPKSSTNMTIVGITIVTSKITSKCDIQIRSLHGRYSWLAVPSICEHSPNSVIDLKSIKIPENLQLAVPEFHLPREVDILIGAGLFWEILCTERINLGPSYPILQRTRLGWITAGPFISPVQGRAHCNLTQAVERDFGKFRSAHQKGCYRSESKPVSGTFWPLIQEMSKGVSKYSLLLVRAKYASTRLPRKFEDIGVDMATSKGCIVVQNPRTRRLCEVHKESYIIVYCSDIRSSRTAQPLHNYCQDLVTKTELIIMKPHKNESFFNLGQRIQKARSAIASKLISMNLAVAERTFQIKNYDELCLKTFIRGLTGRVQDMVRLRNPDSLELAISYVLEEENFMLHQRHTQNEITVLKFSFNIRELIKFHLFKFHEYFDGLIGLDILKLLNSHIDLEIEPHAAAHVKIPVSTFHGDILLPTIQN